MQSDIISGGSLLVTGLGMEGLGLLSTSGDAAPERGRRFRKLNCRSIASEELRCRGLRQRNC